MPINSLVVGIVCEFRKTPPCLPVPFRAGARLKRQRKFERSDEITQVLFCLLKPLSDRDCLTVYAKIIYRSTMDPTRTDRKA